MIGRAAIGALIVAISARGAGADTTLSSSDNGLDLPTRITRHLASAEAATAGGDRDRAAEARTYACVAAIYAADPRTGALCTTAQTAAAPFPRRAAQLAAYLSCAAAWTLDWSRARALAATALALDADRAGSETMADDGRRASHLCLGAVAIEQGLYDEAERELDTFAALSVEAGDRGFESAARTWQCRLDAATGQWARARERCRRGEELADQLGDRWRRSAARWQRGNVEFAVAGAAAAAALWEAGLADAIAAQAPFQVSALRVDLAEAYVELGRLDEAAVLIADHERARRASGLPDSYERQVAIVDGALRASRGDLVGAIAAFDTAATSSMYGVRLFALTHRARAQVALGQLAAARASLTAAVDEIERASHHTTGDEQRRAYIDRHSDVFRGLTMLELAVGGPDAPARAPAAAEAGRARTLLDAVRAAGGVAPAAEAVDVERMQAALAPDAVLIEYVVLDDRAVALRVDQRGIAAVPLPAIDDGAALAARIDFYRDLVAEVDDPAALDEAGAALYRDLLAPVVGASPTGTLIIAADGPLHGLPFEALRVGGQFLIERVELTSTPSATMLATARRPDTATAPMLAVGAPALSDALPPLPEAARELAAVAGTLATAPVTLAGAEATERALRQTLPERFHVLHFATHAVLDDALPLRSGLALTVDDGDDGWLRADEIYRMDLGADLVVLSACRTSAGAPSSSEGPLEPGAPSSTPGPAR
ncbi:MAG: CHAT domain-containing protein [Myxococcales bacterium]|nr:CHAT domain-containing protein [Myxococcales bacterium]